MNNIWEDEEISTIKPDIKRDTGKVRLDLLPPSLYEAVGAVLTHGADKYTAYGWRDAAGADIERYIAAMLRHMVAWRKDPDSVDAESGLPHLWHMAANAAILLDLVDRRKQ